MNYLSKMLCIISINCAAVSLCAMDHNHCNNKGKVPGSSGNISAYLKAKYGCTEKNNVSKVQVSAEKKSSSVKKI